MKTPDFVASQTIYTMIGANRSRPNRPFSKTDIVNGATRSYQQQIITLTNTQNVKTTIDGQIGSSNHKPALDYSNAVSKATQDYGGAMGAILARASTFFTRLVKFVRPAPVFRFRTALTVQAIQTGLEAMGNLASDTAHVEALYDEIITGAVS